jgi:hypothetical protein
MLATEVHLMSHPVMRSVLFVLAAFVAVTTLIGAITVVPTLPLEWLEGSPFADYTIPAIALAGVGIVAAIAALAVAIRPEVAGALAMLAGALMIAFEIVEIVAVGLAIVEHGADEPVAWLQVVYIAVGLAQVALGFALWRVTRPDRERLERTGHHLIGMHP